MRNPVLLEKESLAGGRSSRRFQRSPGCGSSCHPNRGPSRNRCWTQYDCRSLFPVQNLAFVESEEGLRQLRISVLGSRDFDPGEVRLAQQIPVVKGLQPPVLEIGEDGQEAPGVTVLRVQLQGRLQAGTGLVPSLLLEIDAGQFRMRGRVAGSQADGALQFPFGIGPSLLLGQGQAEEKGGLAIGRFLLQNLPKERFRLPVALRFQFRSAAGQKLFGAGGQDGRSEEQAQQCRQEESATDPNRPRGNCVIRCGDSASGLEPEHTPDIVVSRDCGCCRSRLRMDSGG